jgi:hypothetical protein
VHLVAAAGDRLVITLVLCRSNPPTGNTANDIKAERNKAANQAT